MTGDNVTKTECKEKILKHVNTQLNKLNVEQLNKLTAKYAVKKPKTKK